jgi:hypothetical protein
VADRAGCPPSPVTFTFTSRLQSGGTTGTCKGSDGRASFVVTSVEHVFLDGCTGLL